MKSVPAPPGLASSTPVDTLQDLISRKRDAERNKFKYHLTEADCNLLCTHGTTEIFRAGHVFVEGGAPVTKVYRIKSGTVGMYRGETLIKELTRGYFIGETLFVRSTMKSILGCSVVAISDVEVNIVNLPFVKQLLSVDKIMAFKVYRHLASKLSAFLFMSLSHIADNPDLQYHVLSRYLNSSSSSDISSEGSDIGSVDEPSSSESSASTSSLPTATSPIPTSPTPTSPTPIPVTSPTPIPVTSPTTTVLCDDSGENETPHTDFGTQLYLKIRSNKSINTPPRKKRLKMKSTPFRSFSLESPHGHCLLYPERIKFTGTLRQRKIKYNDILDMTKVGPASVTVIYKIQARTIFFKTPEDMTEFMGLVKSLRVSNSRPPSAPGTPTTPTGSPLSMSYDDVMSESDKLLLHSLSVVQTLKKGDVVIAEGDLYQRIYTVVAGQICTEKNGRQLMTIDSGETFGVLSLFHLRPAMVNLVVTSETATVLIVPGYRILDLVNSNFPLAVKMYKKAAQVIYSQVQFIMGGDKSEKPPAMFKGANRALV